MPKNKPQAPRKEEWTPEWDRNAWQGRSKEQVESNNKVAVYSLIIGLGIFIVTVILEIMKWVISI